MSKFINWLETLKPISLPALFLSFSLTLFSFWLLFIRFDQLPPKVPLWFSKEWGESRLAEPYWLWVLPSSSLVIFFFNNLLGSILRQRYTLAVILVWFSAFFSLISLYSIYRLLVLAG